jgi:ribonuclease HI
MKKKEIIIYTDGSSLGNPGPGGWGVLFLANKKIMEMGGYFQKSTNNQMELEAIKQAFLKLVEKKVENYKISIYSDSQYCIKGLTE